MYLFGVGVVVEFQSHKLMRKKMKNFLFQINDEDYEEEEEKRRNRE